MVFAAAKNGSNCLVLVLCALAALTFGFAHRPLDLRRLPAPFHLSAYAVPHGMRPVLRLTKLVEAQVAPADVHEARNACVSLPAPEFQSVSAPELAERPAGAGADPVIVPAPCVSLNQPENVRSRAPPALRAVKV